MEIFLGKSQVCNTTVFSGAREKRYMMETLFYLE